MFSEKFTSVENVSRKYLLSFKKKKKSWEIEELKYTMTKKILLSEKLWETHNRADVLVLSREGRGSHSFPQYILH